VEFNSKTGLGNFTFVENETPMKRISWALITGIISLSSCTSLLPVNNSYEKAGTLQEGNVEFSGHVTKYDVKHFGRNETSNRNFGIRAGYGVSDRFDLKLRYEHLAFTPNFDGKVTSGDYVSIIPKVAAVPEKLSFMLPVGYYFMTEKIEGRYYKKRVSSITPQMVFTLTNRKKKMDFSFSSKMDFLFDLENGENDSFLGMSLGAGFSTDLRKWSIRPEIGISTNAEDATYFSYGIGLQWVLPKRKR
jgi:hypothetical protein